jgi:hypothetical protein
MRHERDPTLPGKTDRQAGGRSDNVFVAEKFQVIGVESPWVGDCIFQGKPRAEPERRLPLSPQLTDPVAPQ